MLKKQYVANVQKKEEEWMMYYVKHAHYVVIKSYGGDPLLVQWSPPVVGFSLRQEQREPWFHQLS